MIGEKIQSEKYKKLKSNKFIKRYYFYTNIFSNLRQSYVMKELFFLFNKESLDMLHFMQEHYLLLVN